MNILYIFLVCSTFVEICFAQAAINEEEMYIYLNSVSYTVLGRLKANGLSKLPDAEVIVPFNITDGISHNITGTLHLKDGFVMDIKNLTLVQNKPKTAISKWIASIETDMRFNISFYWTFRFIADEPEQMPDDMQGGVIIKPKNFYFKMMIMQNLRMYTANCTMPELLAGEVNADSIDFYPKNTLTNRLQYNSKLYDLKTLFPRFNESWQRILLPIFNETIQIIPFPTVEYKK